MGKHSWFEDSGASADLITIERFLDEKTFVTFEGGYGITFELEGVDPECMSDGQLEESTKSVGQVNRLMPEGVTAFQIFIKRRVEKELFNNLEAADKSPRAERLRFLKERPLFETKIYWTLYASPVRSDIRKKALDESEDSATRLRKLRQAGSSFKSSLTNLGPVQLTWQQIGAVYGYIANLKPQAAVPLRSKVRVAEQLANSSVTWYDQGLKFGANRFARVFSLRCMPKHTHADHFGELLRIPAEMIIVVELDGRTYGQVRKRVGQQENFVQVFKHRIGAVAVNMLKKTEPVKSARSVAADQMIEIEGLGGIEHDLTNKQMCYYTCSVIGIIHGTDEAEIEDRLADAETAIGKPEAKILIESLGALSAHEAMFPGAVDGAKPVNKRKVLWVREDHMARMSLIYRPDTGSPSSKMMGTSAPMVYEAVGGVPYFYDPFASGTFCKLVIAASRRGKTYDTNCFLDQIASIGGYALIFDIGGAYENTVLAHDGIVAKFGLDGPRMNPFAECESDEDKQAICELVEVLITSGGAQMDAKSRGEIREAVFSTAKMDSKELRRLSNVFLPLDLQPYLQPWIHAHNQNERNGAYAELFDNVDDELALARVMSLDFARLEGTSKVVDPVVYWVNHKNNRRLRDPKLLHVPKCNFYDEVWRLIQRGSVFDGMMTSMKTGSKVLAGIVLLTQDPNDLGQHGEVIRNGCADIQCLGGPFSRANFKTWFGMHDRFMDVVENLEVGQSAWWRRGKYGLVGKRTVLNVDSKAHWTYATNPEEVRKRNDLFEQYGRKKALDILSQETAA